MNRMPPKRPLVFAAALVCAGACAKEADPAPAAATTPVVDVVATEFSFASPDTLPAGWVTIRIRDDGQQLHHASLARLDDGKTIADLAKLGPTDPLPAWFVPFGGPQTPVPGGGVTEATVHLDAGSYVLFCVIPGPDGVPHLMKGMAKPFVVAGPPGGSEPVADVTLTLTDYAFGLSAPLTAGHHVIKIEVGAGQAHEVLLVRMNPGKRAADLAAWVEKMDGPPPAVPVGGIGPLVPGGTNYVPVDLTPGDYAFLCFLPDAKDGVPHVGHGMMSDFTVQ
ncbi:MAG: hypothetical protein AB7L66_20295 [Gemmatimonadales bacterium]